MTQELALRGSQSIALSADDVVQNASHQAKLLMRIVLQTKCYQEISGKKYLQVEAWETIGAFNRVHAVTEWVNPIMRNGETVGYDAKVNLFNIEGVMVGAAIMPCYFTENACKGKEGDAKDKACKSAAQTFATSKAYRMNYSYVAILAGYEPVPAEEMSGESSDDRPANLKHWCEQHQTKFFKRGKMKGYAHPIGDTGEWCNEDDQKQPETSPAATTSTPEASEVKTSPVAQEPAETPPKTEAKEKPKIVRDPATIKNIGDLMTACYKDFKMERLQTLAELNVKSPEELTESPADCYRRIAAVRETK